MFVFADELRSYLHARSRADIEKDTRPYQTNRRSVAKAWVEREGGLETLFASSSFLENAKYRHDDRPSARDLADLLLLAPDDVRARCEMQTETAHWPKGDFSERIFLLGCFPHRADWALQLYVQHSTVPGVALGWQGASLLLGTLRDRDAILALAKARGVTHEILNLLPDLREDAASLLIEALPFATSSGPQHAVATGLACIGTPEVAAVFAKRLRRSTLRPHALRFFARFPHLASDALSALAKNRKTQAGEVAHAILQMIERSRESAAGGAVAEEDELPTLLREPPWRESPAVEPQAPRTRRPRVVLDLAKPMTPLRLHWPSDARRRWVAHRLQDALLHPDEDELAALRADLEAKNEVRITPSCPKEILFPLLEDVPENVTLWHATPGHVLALHGEEALALVVNGYAEILDDELRLFVESPLLAIAIAGHDLHRVSQIEAALRWIERYPFAAARGLIWAALSRASKKEQAGAAIGLRHLGARGHAGAIEEAIASFAREAPETWSDEAALEIRRIAASQPERDKPRAPRLPAFYRPAEYRPPRLLNGKVLSLDAMQRLDELMCAYATEQPPWPRFEEIRDAFDARSLAEHAWDLARMWELNNAPATSKWMLHAVRHFGDDEVVRRLTPALKDETHIPAMLADLGTHTAAMELLTIYARMRRASSSSHAATQDLVRIMDHLERIVATRGLSAIEDLVDRFVPTYRVDVDGTIALDLGRDGPWRVTWNERLDRVLLDERGEVASTLPRTKADPDKLRAAVTLLADLDEDVRTIAELRATALERAMVTGHAWPYEHFREAWLTHPIMRHMARGVVWEARLANGAFRTFRIAEDSSFADETDEHVALSPEDGVMIGVYHPARHREGAAPVRDRWREMFADYKLIQPFEQLARDPPATKSGELDQLEWTRDRVTAAPRGANYHRFLRAIPRALERAGWVGSARDSRDLRIPFEQVYGAMDRDERKVSVWVIRDGKRVSFRDVDDVVRCELLRALDLVASGEGDT